MKTRRTLRKLPARACCSGSYVVSSSKKDPRAIEQKCLMTGNVVHTFASKKDAVDAIMEANPHRTNRNSVGAQLSAVLRGGGKSRNKTCGGFTYSYAEKQEDHARRRSSNTYTAHHKDTSENRAVEQRCPVTGKVLQRFASRNDAVDAIWEANPDQANRESVASNLSAVLHGRQKTCSGFRYTYEKVARVASNTSPRKYDTSSKNRAVEQRCPITGIVLQTFASLKDAANAILAEAGLGEASRPSVESGIAHVLKGRVKSCRGFVYAYADDAPLVSTTARREDTASENCAVEQQCPATGNVLQRFASQEEAEEALKNLHPDSSRKSIHAGPRLVPREGPSKKCYGFPYTYGDEKEATAVSATRPPPEAPHRSNLAHALTGSEEVDDNNSDPSRVIRQLFIDGAGKEQTCIFMLKRAAARELAKKHDMSDSKESLDAIEQGISDVLNGERGTFMHCQFSFVDFFG